MQNFRDLIVWKKAHRNVLLIYARTKSFPKEELYGITSQLRRAELIFLSIELYQELNNISNEVKAMLISLIKKVRS